MERANTRLLLLSVGLMALASSEASARPDVLFQDDFESTTIKSAWTWAHLSKETPFTRFSGRYSNNTIKLTLDAPKGPRGMDSGGGGDGGNGDGGNNGGGGGGGGGGDGGNNGGGGGSGGGSLDRVRYTMTLDLFIIDSWDGEGSGWGSDRLKIKTPTEVIFDESFGNAWLTQSFREPDVGRFNMAYNSYADAIYRDVTVEWEQAAGEQIKLWFYDSGLQGVGDESWGIDNVEIEYQFVPSAGTLPMACMGGLLVARRRR
jgi:hypothetical protein